ncbi:MAG: CRISPR-associated helicase Cas3' [Erysipelotrichaceae bacterium]|nr:CRISPR-associated helicase Cas3' [Erysipelotrichaceae bacterium]
MNIKEYIAHKNKDQEQTIKSHLESTAEIARNYAVAFNSGDHAEMIGLYHDIGKYSNEFQNRIRNQTGRVDHSTAGAYELFRNNDLDGALCIAGHHSGLQNLGDRFSVENDGSFAGRMKSALKNEIPDYSFFRNEISQNKPITEPFKPKGFEEYVYIKFLYSCLVDADYLDTEHFMKGSRRKQEFDSFTAMLDSLEKYREQFKYPKTKLDKIRNQIYEDSISAGEEKECFYSLSAPTGAGKTLASLGFSLKKAICNKKNRIIYVIPYTSIIDQTVSIFDSIIGKRNVLPHYSEYDFDDQDENEYIKKLATENWDFPIVVTTAVQFFESLFSNRSSKSRKIHNIANSVIVFDEYQMIPTDCLLPCVRMINELMKHYNCTVLLSTATQPGTDQYEEKCKEIVSDVEDIHKELRRVSYEQIDLNEDSLAEQIVSRRQCLVIVNTRRTAQEVYKKIAGKDSFHLSTLMPPKLRRKKLKEIRQRLEEGQNCRVVATSLIEAGVDVDFPIVYREINGLDSIIQAGGRCNREFRYKPEESKVYIVNMNNTIPLSQRKNKEAMEEAVKLADTDSQEAIKAYYHILYDLKGEENLDKNDIVSSAGKLKFEDVNEEFRFIKDRSKTIYIPYDSISQDLIKCLKNGERSRSIFRKLGEYGVNVDQSTYSILLKDLSIAEFDEIAILNDLGLFSYDTGLLIPNGSTGIGIFI